MYHFSSAGYKNVEIEIHKGCFAYYVSDCYSGNSPLAALRHYDQQFFDYCNQYCSAVFFNYHVVFNIQEQGKEKYCTQITQIYNRRVT